MQFEGQIIIYGVIGSFIVLIFSLAVLHDITKKTIEKLRSKDVDDNNNTSMDIRIMIYLNLLLIFIHMISLLYRLLFVRNDSYCNLFSKIGITLFQATRCLMYIIFVRRIQIIYNDTVFEMKQKYIYLLYTFIAIYSIPFMLYLNFDSAYNPKFGCSMQFNSDLLFSFVSLLDISISICCVYLFIYPLYKLLGHQEDNEIKNQLYNVMIKYSILYLTAICSSLLLIIISYIFLFGFYYAIIDGLINGMMLILLHPLHNILYRRMCCLSHKLCIKCCNKINNTDCTCNTKKSETKDIRLQLTPISVNLQILDNITTSNDNNNITETKQQIPINVLLTHSVSNIYKFAAASQPAFNPNSDDKPIPVTPSNANSEDIMKQKAIESYKSNTLKMIDYESTDL